MAIQAEMLQRTSKNLERLRDYFETRIYWTVPEDAQAGISALHMTLKTALSIVIGPLLARNGVEPNPTVTHRRVEQTTVNSFETDRLERFSGFLEQLSDWFIAHGGDTTTPTDRDLLEKIFRIVENTCLAIEAVLKNNSIEFSPQYEPPPPNEPKVTEMEGGNVRAKLVLDDTEETPVLWEFRGEIELHYDAKQSLHQFLEDAGLKYSSYELTKFENKVLGWVKSRPHGYVLIIKISTLHDKREPYPTYDKKENLG